MRAVPKLQSYHLRIMIVGDNEKGYGKLHPTGRPLRTVMLEELAGKLVYLGSTSLAGYLIS